MKYKPIALFLLLICCTPFILTGCNATGQNSNQSALQEGDYVVEPAPLPKEAQGTRSRVVGREEEMVPFHTRFYNGLSEDIEHLYISKTGTVSHAIDETDDDGPIAAGEQVAFYYDTPTPDTKGEVCDMEIVMPNQTITLKEIPMGDLAQFTLNTSTKHGVYAEYTLNDGTKGLAYQ